ncbi:MAG: hypothetical protein K0U38_11590, partial [Epsilonproteobacteria bacterium]|nr:hypothetical protein [Campylobacterota bacterium]
MAITLKIDNPEIEQQKQDVEKVTVDMLQFLLYAFQKKENLNAKKIVKDELDGFQELSNISLEKVWDNQEDE